MYVLLTKLMACTLPCIFIGVIVCEYQLPLVESSFSPSPHFFPCIRKWFHLDTIGWRTVLMVVAFLSHGCDSQYLLQCLFTSPDVWYLQNWVRASSFWSGLLSPIYYLLHDSQQNVGFLLLCMSLSFNSWFLYVCDYRCKVNCCARVTELVLMVAPRIC